MRLSHFSYAVIAALVVFAAPGCGDPVIDLPPVAETAAVGTMGIGMA